MAQVVIMPKQGQSVESCIVSEFKVKVGDSVQPGDILFGYETDKATFEEEAKTAGTVLAIFWENGDEIPVLQNVLVIGEPGESFEAFRPVPVSPSSTPKEAPSASRPIAPAAAGTHEAAPPAASQGSFGGGVSPRARMLASAKGLPPERIAGSGPGGRVIARDVLAAARVPLSGLAKARLAADSALTVPSRGSGLAGTVLASDLKGPEFQIVPMSNMRKRIAGSMFSSLQSSAQLTHMLGADARAVMALRRQAKKALEEGRLDVNITINDFVCYAVVRALQAFPNVNSHCLGDSLRIFGCVNLGLAVDTERGLMVPAVPHADNLDIVSLSRALKTVAEDSKKGSINPDLLSPEAASFTVSNLGAFGVEWFTPIINVPQSGILGVGTVVPRPVRVGDEWQFVPYMSLSLTYDHRAIDGGEATRFLKKVAEEIENLKLEF